MDTRVGITGRERMLLGLPVCFVLRTYWKECISSTGKKDHIPEQQIHKGMIWFSYQHKNATWNTYLLIYMTLVLIRNPLNLMSFSIDFDSVGFGCKFKIACASVKEVLYYISKTMFTTDDMSCHFDYKKSLCRELLIVALIKSQTRRTQYKL